MYIISESDSTCYFPTLIFGHVSMNLYYIPKFTICYGDKPNSELFVEYGFVMDDNIYNSVSIPMGELIQCQPVEELDSKLAYLDAIGIKRTRYGCIVIDLSHYYPSIVDMIY